jgi:serine protease
MSNHRLHLRRALLIALTAIAALACDRSDGSDSIIGPGDGRAPLGIAAKPILDTASGAVVADEILVRFADGVPASASRVLASLAGGDLIYVAPQSGYAVIRFRDAATAAAGAAALNESNLVADVARNHVMHGEADASGTGIGTSPSRTIGGLQWNLYAMGLDPFGARPLATGVNVAVLDTGVAFEGYSDALGTYLQAPTLAETTFAPGYDFINDDAHPNDDQRHGTHIASVIAASSGIASFAPGATIMPVKVLDSGNSGSELALAEGIRYATDHGARVINMSLAFPPTYFPSRLLQSAVDYASQHGVIMIAAVGNHGEDLISYPAAFRDVIAVGASELPDSYVTGGDPVAEWQTAQAALVNAPYSNRSYKVDVLAPGGEVTRDANGDGLPEGILAQTFEPGQPTNFGYYFYAGTSQAAAEVTGVVATMLKLNPALDAHAVRGILVESSQGLGGFMTTSGGRGVLQADLAIAAAAAGDVHAAERERFDANVVVTLHDDGSDVLAQADVEMLDGATGEPAAGLTVYGLYTGAAFGAVSAVTDENGVAHLISAPLAGNYVVAFQVDAVARGQGAFVAFDRPRGFLRIESVSLERLSAFGQVIEEIITAGGGGDGTSAGSGIGTSPSNPSLPGTGIVFDPLRTPVTIGFDPVVFPASGYRRTLLLPNFSWGLATTPMSVAVDEAWFLSSFSDAAARRVVSRGSGLGGSPMLFDDASFGSAPPPAPVDVPSVPLIVLTYASATGIGTSPSYNDTSGGTGIGTSPSIGVGRVIVDRTFSGLDVTVANDIDRLVAGVFAAGSGIGTSPSFSEDGPWSFPPTAFSGLANLATRYGAFSTSVVAAPVASYGSALGAAAMPLAPVAPESIGPGVVYAPIP